jgi:ketosteroid isomerase-like protein
VSENAELVKRGLDAYNRRDAEALKPDVTPDVEWFPAIPAAVEHGGYQGHEGVERYLRELSDTWDYLRIVGDDIRDLGERVLFLGRVEGRGKGSGVRVDAPVGLVFELRGDKASRIRGYLDHHEALRAVGLSGRTVARRAWL